MSKNVLTNLTHNFEALPLDMLGSDKLAAALPRLSSYTTAALLPDVVCLSHLRWDFVYQRPQHLLSRFARERRVFFVEEPVYDAAAPQLDVTRRECGVYVAVPHLPAGMPEEEAAAWQQALLQDDLLLACGVTDYLLWYYTPLALAFTRQLEPLAVVYDCMDELSAFKNAPPALKQHEAELFERADVVFTGGQSLYEAKTAQHPNVHSFPSSIDAAHFRQARLSKDQAAEQTHLPQPRLGYCGVIDERLDIELLAGLAEARPDWQFVMIGPVVKIDPADLPQHPNIHYLGGKPYQELPAYLSGWNIALLPFARNEATRYISPTKTPEYLAAGVPAISTSIRDVINPWGHSGLVKIADSVPEVIAAAEEFLSANFDQTRWLRQVDEMLASNSWDRTWTRMAQKVNQAVQSRYPDLVAPRVVPPATVRSVTSGVAAVSPMAGD